MSDSKRTAGYHWSLLRQGDFAPSKDELPTRLANVEVTAGPLRFALGPAQEARLLLPLSKSEKVGKLPVSTSLRIKETHAVIDGSTSRLLDIMCTVKELESVFTEVVDEILSRIQEGTSVPSALRSTLHDFRALLFLTPTKTIPTEIVLGLVGELFVLNELLDRSPEAWRAWMGPQGGRHDFRAGSLALEVKSTRSASNTLVTIQSVDQLSVPSGGQLYLTRLTLEPTPGGVLNVANLYNRAALRCSEPEKLKEILLGLDCSDPSADEWNHLSFSFEGEEVFEVGGSFPRLTEDNFVGSKSPQGVLDISYKIDLSHASDCIITSDKKETIQNELIACLSPE
ncbi:PD-(D/E)XK motif protein [Marinobacter xiaoshiensis]|uniref:PD-(D/E)XK motif protein n=1 Tax=Marinobacter xiaoshiensis TaxID=3073652 RepID=A0ABU2HCU0_9GAMM|nr:PD-(D/E)XK motif protein [Marinobacter sp. F60267]MDS1308887.1 PD-(D/E)XK motif protein [Marinobacter sp. F60267]